MRSQSTARLGLLTGLAAAATFGASTPFAKLLLEDVAPQMLAGFLYLGAFLALLAAVPSRGRRREARLRASDSPLLAGIVVSGGIAAPVLLLVGLERVSGSAGSLLLNLEGPLTLVLGLILFREHLGRRAAWGAAAIFVAAALLAVNGPGLSIDALGVLAIAAACLLWGVDNNLTQVLTVRDPVQLVAVKAGVAAAVNVGMAMTLGATVPPGPVLVGALVLGAIGYGLSILLDAYALRAVGAARESAIFATAPFVGAILAVPVLSEMLTTRELVAAAVMAVGVILVLGERHEHLHAHEPLVHEHLHRHDEHHHHVHEPGTSSDEPHSHRHEHERLVHSHPHVSDVHHRHQH